MESRRRDAAQLRTGADPRAGRTRRRRSPPAMLREARIASLICPRPRLRWSRAERGVGLRLVTEEALRGRDLRRSRTGSTRQPEWSDLPFVLLTQRAAGSSATPSAAAPEALGNVTFLERPFHPTTLVSLARAALRGRLRQYDARARLEAPGKRGAADMRNETLEARVEERTREHELALAKLHEAQKIETLGQLTGGVAHDFNNLLTPVIGNLDLLRRRLPPNVASQRLIDAALQAASRAATLVQRLLAFARRQDLQRESVDVGILLDGMTDLLAPLARPGDRGADQPLDPGCRRHGSIPTSSNSRSSISRSTRATPCRAAARCRSTPTPFGRGRERFSPGDYVRITVARQRLGMDQQTLARAVEPFFSTKGVGKGTGLGLSMVHGLAAQLGGVLDLNSTPGEGTTAEIWLPVATEAASCRGSSIPTRSARSRSADDPAGR